MTELREIIPSDPDILGGGTLDEFLRQFPSVSRRQAIAALDLARIALVAGVRTS